jgi:hypothetical protein
MPHAGQLTAGGVDLLGEAGVEDQRGGLDVVKRGHVRVHREVAVKHRPDQVVLLEPEPGLDDLRGVVGEHADPVAAPGAKFQHRRPDAVGSRVEVGEAQCARLGRERGSVTKPLGRLPDQCTRFDLHVCLPCRCVT